MEFCTSKTKKYPYNTRDILKKIERVLDKHAQ